MCLIIAMMAASMFGIIPFIILFNFIISLIGKTTVRTFIGDSIASKLFTILVRYFSATVSCTFV